MKIQLDWRRNRLPILLITVAIALLCAAFAMTDQEEVQVFIPLNEVVEQALNELDSQEMVSMQENNQPNEAENPGEIDINRAGMSELQTLKGIGPSKANAIIMEREENGFFQSTDDLLRVKGIGPKLLAGIKESIVARP